jgi:lipoprotein signal peptidase
VIRLARKETLSLVFLVLLDRLLKMSIENPLFSERFLGWRFFALERHHNFGVAFNIPIPLWIVIPLTLFFLITLFVWVKKIDNHRANIGFFMIFVGALSNAFDRVTYGYTIDYLRVVNAIINIADILVVAGMIILVSKQVSAKK